MPKHGKDEKKKDFYGAKDLKESLKKRGELLKSLGAVNTPTKRVQVAENKKRRVKAV